MGRPHDMVLLIVSMSMSILLYWGECHVVMDDEMNLVEVDEEQRVMKQKMSQFRVYWHDIASGKSPSSIPIVKPVTKTGFGQVNMIDNPLTLGPQLSSKVVGKSQGFYSMASQEEIGLLMVMNFYFTTGKYNGSSIAILGRNAVFDHVREMPVIGGSGLFRWARGYAQARTHSLNFTTGDATVQYTLYVMHYS